MLTAALDCAWKSTSSRRQETSHDPPQFSVEQEAEAQRIARVMSQKIQIETLPIDAALRLSQGSGWRRSPRKS